MKRIIALIIILMCVCSVNTRAESDSYKNFIDEQAELSGADRLNEALPQDVQDYFDSSDISAGENDWIKNLSVGGVLKGIWKSIKSKITTPLATMGLILAVILISSIISAVNQSKSTVTSAFAVTAVSAAVVTAPILGVINSSVEIMQGLSIFMTAFVPVFAAIIAANGQMVTGISMSSLLLGATQIVELIATHLVIPLMSGYLSISIASSVSPLLSKTTLGESIKKLSFWIMSLVTTVFLGVLSIQTTINASADSLTIRTARFVIGSSVPVAGTVLSEALTTVTASLGVLKTSVAIYGVVACCVIFLPLLTELLMWRFCLNATAFAADVLTVADISKLLKSIDMALSVLCGLILLSMALFVISLTVVVSVSRV